VKQMAEQWNQHLAEITELARRDLKQK